MLWLLGVFALLILPLSALQARRVPMFGASLRGAKTALGAHEVVVRTPPESRPVRSVVVFIPGNPGQVRGEYPRTKRCLHPRMASPVLYPPSTPWNAKVARPYLRAAACAPRVQRRGA